MRILVIGGGASGMTAALTAAARPEHRVTLLERQARVGRKLAATGNGRCNLTNCSPGAFPYHGGDPDFARPALAAFPQAETLSWFASLGLLTTEEPSGRVYPFSDQAGSVVDVLRLALEQRGVQVETGCEVTALSFRDGAFFAETAQRRFAADRVIVACGGAAGGKLGGGDAGYRLLAGFGHRCTALHPALVQLRTDPTWVRSLKGVRAEAGVRLLCGGDLRAESRGEVQFTEYGLSGPAVFEISRAASTGSGPMAVVLDLLPPMDEASLSHFLEDRTRRNPALTMENLLTGLLQNRLGRTVVRACGYAFEQPLKRLDRRGCRAVAHAVKDFRLSLLGTLGMDQAQVTAGGVRTDEFDPVTLESRLQPGLYACGEVLDIDGDCGGWNLQWAWSSGRAAGLGEEGRP